MVVCACPSFKEEGTFKDGGVGVSSKERQHMPENKYIYTRGDKTQAGVGAKAPKFGVQLVAKWRAGIYLHT